MNQNERLDYLVEQFKEDSVQYSTGISKPLRIQRVRNGSSGP